MVWNRRFLRVAALGAVFALGLAGTALAAPTTYTWQGGASGHEKDWAQNDNWLPNTGHPGSDPSEDGDIAVIGPSAEVELGSNKTVATVDLSDDVKLTIAANKLTIKNGELRASGNATVTSKAAGGLTFDTVNNVAVSADKTLTLAAETPGTIVGDAAAALKLANGGNAAGTLVLAAPVTTVKKLDIDDGGTVVVGVNDALPNYDGANLTITKGSLVINGENFGKKGGVADLNTLTLTEGDLTLNKKMHTTAKKVVISKGTLTVGSGVEIGDGTNGEVDLKATGNLVLEGDLTIKDLTTAAGSKIKTNDKTLTVVDFSGGNLEASVAGNLKLTPSAAWNVTLKQAVAGKVEVVAKGGTSATLTVEERVDSLEFTSDGTATAATLKLAADKTVGSLTFDKANDFAAELRGNSTIEKLLLKSASPLKVKSDGAGANTINFLEPFAGTVLKVDGTKPLSILDGAGDKDWKVEVPTNQLAVMGQDLVKGLVEAKLTGGTLTLPSGTFPKLDLKVETDDSKIAVDVASQDPVLKVKTIDVVTAGKKLTMECPTMWALPLSGNVTLLAAQDAASVTGAGTIEGNLADPSLGTINWDDPTKTLILTPGAGLQFPVLKKESLSFAGNKFTVDVKVVSGSVPVAPATWNGDMRLVVPYGSIAAVPAKSLDTADGVRYEVTVTDEFQRGVLRVSGKKAVASMAVGVLDVELVRSGGGSGGGGSGDSGDKVGGNLNKPESWSRTAISGDTVVLTSKLKLEGTPKSLKVKASGMKNEPKAELLDATGKVVAKSSVPSVSAAKDYTLRLTCKTTQAEIDKGAKIEQVTVTMSDGTHHDIPVNVKLSDMKIGTPDGKKPGGDNGGGKNPGGDNGGGKNPGGDNGGGKNPGGEDDGKKGSSGGGCDAGFGGLALALGAAFLLKRKA